MDRGAWWDTVHGITKQLGTTVTKQQQQVSSLGSSVGGCWWNAERLSKIFNDLFGFAGSSLQHVKSNSLTKD